MAEKKFVRTDPINWQNAKAAGKLWAQNYRLGDPNKPDRKQLPTDLAKVRNDTGDDRRAGEVLEIGELILDPEQLTNEFPWFEGITSTGTEKHGILRKALPDGAITGPGGELQITGCCKAWVDLQSVDDERAGPVTGEHVLRGGSGPYIILWKPDGETGEQECFVARDGGSGAKIVRFQLGAAATIQCSLCQAEATVMSGSPGTPARGETITVFDLIGAFLNEPPDDLEGRKGYAAEMTTDLEECAIDPELTTKWEIISLGCIGSCPDA